MLTSVLNKVRNNAIKLSEDYLSTRAETVWADVNHLCLKKGPYGKQVVFCINNKSSNGDSYEVSVGGFQTGEKVVEVLGCKVNTADAMGNVTMYMGKGEPKVYIPQLALEGTGLCAETEQDAAISGAAALGLTGSILVAAVIGWATIILG